MPEIIRPRWPAPDGVVAFTTTRQGGVSEAPCATFNLGAHVSDDPDRVRENRRRLREEYRLPAEPLWLEQEHGIRVVDAGRSVPGARADASFSTTRGRVCAVLTADCLPVLLADEEGRAVASSHAGWRGLAAGVLEETVRSLPVDSGRILAWLGPAIGPQAFQVGEEVRERFIRVDERAVTAFVPDARGRFLADLYTLARLALQSVGVHRVYGGDYCTFTDEDLFFSYRRDGICGRMASVIWLE